MSGALAAWATRGIHHPPRLQGYTKRQDQLKPPAGEAAVLYCQGGMNRHGPSACFVYGSILESSTACCCQQGAWSLWVEDPSHPGSCSYCPDSPFLPAVARGASPALGVHGLALLPCSIPSLPSPLLFLCSGALALTWQCSAGGSNSKFSYPRNLQLPLYFWRAALN